MRTGYGYFHLLIKNTYVCLCLCVPGGASISKQRADLLHLCFLWLSDGGRRAGADWRTDDEEGEF